LFGAVVYILQNSDDEVYKDDCRRAILFSDGEAIKFPDPGKQEVAEFDCKSSV
jgi:hypothetical protein